MSLKAPDDFTSSASPQRTPDRKVNVFTDGSSRSVQQKCIHDPRMITTRGDDGISRAAITAVTPFLPGVVINILISHTSVTERYIGIGRKRDSDPRMMNPTIGPFGVSRGGIQFEGSSRCNRCLRIATF